MDAIKLRYSEDFICEAIRSYWWKQIGPIFPVVTLLLALFLGYRIINGDRTWLEGMLGTVIVLGLAVMMASYYVHLRRALQRLERMKKPEATLELGDDQFRISSDVGSSEIKWSLISHVWCFDNVWLLFFSAGEFMTLPIKGMSPEAKSFIISKAKANGAKVDEPKHST